MLKGTHIYRRFVVSGTLIVLMFFAFVPATMAASHQNSQPQWSSGLKQHYLALGDSLAYGFQPCILNNTCTNSEGYVYQLFHILQKKGTGDVTNYGCPGETSTTLINGGKCDYSPAPSQLVAALAYLQANAGKVSPVTLDIGANDVLPDTDFQTCKVDVKKFRSDLATLDANLTQVILPQLKAALKVNGKTTGEIVMMNYYDPLQNACPNSVKYTRTLNRHLASDVHGFGSIVDVFEAFGGAKTPNPKLCSYTWMCTPPPLGPDIHATNTGYGVIADTFADEIL